MTGQTKKRQLCCDQTITTKSRFLHTKPSFSHLKNRTDGKVNTGFVPRKLLPLFCNILYLNYNIAGFFLSRGLKIDSTPKIVMDLLTAFSLCSGEFFILFKLLWKPPSRLATECALAKLRVTGSKPCRCRIRAALWVCSRRHPVVLGERGGNCKPVKAGIVPLSPYGERTPSQDGKGNVQSNLNKIEQARRKAKTLLINPLRFPE